MEPISIVCIIGPTASGKTARAIAYAKEHGGEVISVDSRQVYRTLDIGTEKITVEEMQGIPHHLIDVCDPDTIYSAGDFVKDATHLIREIHERGNVPILAGGTHFYFDALLHGLPEETPKNETLRAELETLTTEALFGRIEEQDMERAETIDPHNRRRLIRALEILSYAEKVPSRMPLEEYDVTWIVVDLPKEELQERITTRLAEALRRGLVAEVTSVRANVGDERLNELGLEYRIVGEYLRGERTEDTLLPTLSSKLWQYARSQKKWITRLTETTTASRA